MRFLCVGIILTGLFFAEGGQGCVHAQQRWDDYVYHKHIVGSGIGNHRIHHCVPDTGRGFYVVWGLNVTVEDGQEELVHLQHVDSTGVLRFEPRDEGCPVSPAGIASYYPDIIADSAGGAFVSFVTHTCDEFNHWHGGIRVIHAGPSGKIPDWEKNIWTDEISYMFPPQLASDMRGGAWVIAYTDSSMRMKRLTSDGTVLGPDTGTVITETIYKPIGCNQPDVISDGAGGVFIVWIDTRKAKAQFITGIQHYDIWAQHVDSTGALLWGETGIPIDTSEGWHTETRLMSDSSGGVFITYYNNIDNSVYIQRIHSDGTPAWAPRTKWLATFREQYATTLPWEDTKYFVAPTEDGVIVVTAEYLASSSRLHRTIFQRVNTKGMIPTNSGNGIIFDNPLQCDGIAPDDSGGVFMIFHKTVHDWPNIDDEWTSITVQRRSYSGLLVTRIDLEVFKIPSDIPVAFSDPFAHRRSNILPDSRRGVIGVWATSTKIAFNTFRNDIFAFRTNAYGSVYPVELAAFDAQLSGEAVALSWRTEAETNNYGFYVERSYNKEHWEDAGFVSGHGTQNTASEYAFTDPVPVSLNALGNVYYRLRQQDYDGTLSYSPIVSVTLESIAASPAIAMIHPQPAQTLASVTVTLPESGNISLRLYNELGQVAADIAEDWFESGTYSIPFATTDLPSGMYLCVLNAGGTVCTKTMTVVR